jgi:curved DNA-binding protein
LPFDPYAILGVTRAASKAEVRTAYHERARKLHPDVNRAPDAVERFKELTIAYSVLSDEAKRRDFDEFGEAVLRSLFDAGLERAARDRESGREPDDPVAVLGGTRRAPPRRERGPRDLVLQLPIDPAKAASGGTVRVASPVGGGVLTVTIPAGATHGQRLRLLGKGRARADGRPGDLYLELLITSAKDQV